MKLFRVNAFAIKVFFKVFEYIPDLDTAPLCSAKQWLITQQDEQGHFVDEQRIFNDGIQVRMCIF